MTTSPSPNCFLVGAPKAGTTAMAAYLGEHPQVYFSTPKEPQYWASDLPASKHEMRPRSMDEYLELFSEAPDDAEIIAEGSTNYLRSREAIPSLLAFNPDARIIVMVRDPAEIAVAFHSEQLYSGCETVDDFWKAWQLQGVRERGEDPSIRLEDAHQVQYRQVAQIGHQLHRLFEITRPSQRLVILLDDVRADARKEYLRVLQFLGLEDDGRTTFPPVNVAHAQRFPVLSRALLHPPAPLVRPIRALRSRVIANPNPLTDKVKSVLRVDRGRAPIDDRALAEVRDSLAPEVRLVSELLGRDLTHWL